MTKLERIEALAREALPSDSADHYNALRDIVAILDEPSEIDLPDGTHLDIEIKLKFPDDVPPVAQEAFVQRLQDALSLPVSMQASIHGPLDKVREWLRLFETATHIFESDIDWETKYNLIFSDDIVGRMSTLYRLDYYDPDQDYSDDVRAWYSAASEKADELRKLLA